MAASRTDTRSRAATAGPSLFDRVDALFTTVARARTCAADIERISMMSDAELDRRGMSRTAAMRQAARVYL